MQSSPGYANGESGSAYVGTLLRIRVLVEPVTGVRDAADATIESGWEQVSDLRGHLPSANLSGSVVHEAVDPSRSARKAAVVGGIT